MTAEEQPILPKDTYVWRYLVVEKSTGEKQPAQWTGSNPDDGYDAVMDRIESGSSRDPLSFWDKYRIENITREGG